MANSVIASATDVWQGEHAVDWSSTLKISADKLVPGTINVEAVPRYFFTICL